MHKTLFSETVNKYSKIMGASVMDGLIEITGKEGLETHVIISFVLSCHMSSMMKALHAIKDHCEFDIEYQKKLDLLIFELPEVFSKLTGMHVARPDKGSTQ